MILVTRPSGEVVALNCDLLERVEGGLATSVWLIDGTSVEVRESVAEVVDRVREFRASVVWTAEALSNGADHRPPLRVITPLGLTDERGA